MYGYDLEYKDKDTGDVVGHMGWRDTVIHTPRRITSDAINSPDHYKHNEHGIECIDAIKASMSKLEYEGALKKDVIKYIWRFRYKGKPVEDLEKAKWYLDKLIESVKNA